jgi:hypothetical protein
MLLPAALVLAAGLIVVACGGDEPSGDSPDGPLTESKVIQLFLEYACPGAPGLAQALYRPFAQQLPAGAWLLRTSEGQFRFSESTRTFETDPDATKILEDLRAKGECASSQRGRLEPSAWSFHTIEVAMRR